MNVPLPLTEERRTKILVSLSDLANLSIGTPQVGAVNFNALHALLHAIIKHLNIQNVKVEIPEDDEGQNKPSEGLAQVADKVQGGAVALLSLEQIESKIQELEKKMEALNKLPTGSDLLERTKQVGSTAPVNDMWQMMQMKKQIETNEDGVAKSIELIQELLHTINALQDSHRDVENQLQKVTETIGPGDWDDVQKRLSRLELQKEGDRDLDKLQQELESTKQLVKDLEERLGQYPCLDELNNLVGWDKQQETLVERTPAMTLFTDLDARQGTLPVGREEASLGVSSLAKEAQEQLSTRTSVPIHVTESEQETASNHTGVPTSTTLPNLLQIPAHTHTDLSIPKDAPSHTVVPVLAGVPSYTAEGTQAGVPSYTVTSSKTSWPNKPIEADITPTHLGGSVPSFTGIATAENKPNEADITPTHPGGPVPSFTGIATAENTHPPASNSVGSNPSALAPDPLPGVSQYAPMSAAGHPPPDIRIQEIDSQSAPCTLPSNNILNKTPFNNLLGSSSRTNNTCLRYADTVEALRSIGALSVEYALLRERVELVEKFKADRAELRALPAQQVLPDTSTDLSDFQTKLKSILTDLQDLKEDRKKDVELLGPIRNKMLQLQEECEQLKQTAGSLIQDHQQKQRDIDILYQELEKLNEKKADKDHIELEIDVKADKRSLDRKVSCTQFDATAEQLNNMIQELLGRVSRQEQDWQRVLEKINTEMQRKLDRMELDPLRNKLEERWKSIRRQLQERSQPETDEAAGIRKQLVSHFHCLSCDRALDIAVPGPPILTIPNIPGLPARRNKHPYIAYELEQIRQQIRRDRSPPMADCSYRSGARNCGGSHTLTYAQQRYVRLQNIASYSTTEEEPVGGGEQYEEVQLIGLDGHVYRGRMNIRLPAIPAKAGVPKTKLSQGSQKSVLPCDGTLPSSRPPSSRSATRSLTALSQTSLELPCSDVQGKASSPEDVRARNQETLEVRMDLACNQQCADESVM